LGSDVGLEVVVLVVSVLVVVLEDVVVVVVVAGSMGAACGDGIVEEGRDVEEVLAIISGSRSVFVPG
jgi:hypothetical protein